MDNDNTGPLAADRQWRDWVRDHPIAAATIAGAIATQMATIIGYYLIGIGLPAVPWPLFNGILVAPAGEFGGVGSFFAGQSIHMVDGVVFAILFAVLVFGKLPFATTTNGNVQRGLVYGAILAIISAGFLVPYVYVPKQGFGLFSFDGPDGWKLPASILVFHLVWGGFLGMLYNPSRRASDSYNPSVRASES